MILILMSLIISAQSHASLDCDLTSWIDGMKIRTIDLRKEGSSELHSNGQETLEYEDDQFKVFIMTSPWISYSLTIKGGYGKQEKKISGVGPNVQFVLGVHEIKLNCR